MSGTNKDSITTFEQDGRDLLSEKPSKVLKLQDLVHVKQYLGKDTIIPLSERAFLRWEDINFFVPTDVDPMASFNYMTSQKNSKIDNPEIGSELQMEFNPTHLQSREISESMRLSSDQTEG